MPRVLAAAATLTTRLDTSRGHIPIDLKITIYAPQPCIFMRWVFSGRFAGLGCGYELINFGSLACKRYWTFEGAEGNVRICWVYRFPARTRP